MKHSNNILSKKKLIIPSWVKEKLDILYTKDKYQNPSKLNFVKCILIIIYHQINEGDDYVPLAANYWRKVFGGDYHKNVLAPLIDEKIIEVKPVTDNTKEEFKKKRNYYRINPELFNDKFVVVEYKNSKDNRNIYHPFKDFDKFIIKDKNLKISIDYDKTIEWIDDNAENIFSSYYHPEFINEDLSKIPSSVKVFTKDDSKTEYNVNISDKSKITSGHSFFYYKNLIYLANYQEFHDYKVDIIKKHYKYKVNELVNTEIETSRSKLNHRLSNQLVTFPSKLLPFVTINNASTVQIDLRTSQFLIFANLINSFLNNKHQELIQFFKYQNTKDYLKKLFEILETYKKLLPSIGINIDVKKDEKYYNDVHQFISDIFYQDFYGVVQNELGLKDRGLAKHILFLLIFKRKKNSNFFTDKLIKKYRTIISIMNEFKASNSQEKKVKTDSKEKEDINVNQDNNFAVMLQCVEAELFIDKILIPLQKRGIPCFSRHDSIVVDHRYRDDVENQIKDVFNKIGFYFVTKEDDFFWDVADIEEAEMNGFLDYISDLYEYDELSRLAGDVEYQLSLQTKSDSTSDNTILNNIINYGSIPNDIIIDDSISDNSTPENSIINNSISDNIVIQEDKSDLFDEEIDSDGDTYPAANEIADFLKTFELEESFQDYNQINIDNKYNLDERDVYYLLNELGITTAICDDYFEEVSTTILEEISNQDYISDSEKGTLQDEIIEQFELKSSLHYSYSTNKIIKQLIYSIYDFLKEYNH